MKKLLIAFIILIPLVIAAQDFRNVSWGMTIDEVRNTESNTQAATGPNTTLTYNVKVNEFDLVLQYIFSEDNKLIGASYFRQMTSNNYLEAYRSQKRFFLSIRDGLNLKYGNAILPNKEIDIFLFYDQSTNSIKKYVNDDLYTFLDATETSNNIENKHITKNIFSIGYSYCIKYSTDTTIIILLVQQKRENIHQEILYIDKNEYALLNNQLRKKIIESSDL